MQIWECIHDYIEVVGKIYAFLFGLNSSALLIIMFRKRYRFYQYFSVTMYFSFGIEQLQQVFNCNVMFP